MLKAMVCSYCKKVFYNEEECKKHENICRKESIIMQMINEESKGLFNDADVLPYIKMILGKNRMKLDLIDDSQIDKWKPKN
jgi:hypothetical protein